MTGKTKTRGIDKQLVHVVAHHVRVQALTILAERTASPKEIALELGETVTTVSHHVSELAKMGLVEIVEEQPRRGVVEHFYRAIMRPLLSSEEWNELSLEDRQRFSVWIMQLILIDGAKALAAGTFDARFDRHLSRVPLFVDEKGWREAVAIQNKALNDLLEAQAASAERLAKGKGEGFHVSASMICIEMPAPRQKRL